ncbi:hypothetical protein CGCA056_v012004 [Colletotrichum aenigma]|uniref:uncharacterized protein n=1 Tax=Colletotrichum aenigma TaxID=1215731 RepID=UPI001872FACA|nr:uncharacterized protein CGCA056_v012004 [Colletotrichum aenigma]KAF5512114.1 hypothetical protein CGCA056_v012004 [Colletotrichum aenigma]
MCYSDDVPTGTLERDHCTDWATSQNVAVKVDGPCPLPLAPWIPRTLSEVPKGSRHYTGVNESRHEIKIAIICALTLEADAIHALFDEHWHGTISTQMRSPGDTNSYSFGVICGYPVVLVHMPGMGKSNASSVATNCRNSFPNVKLALVVGVCGAVPFYGDRKEIILGDVIISEGLVPYDFGRRYTDKLIRREVLAKPPPEIRGLLNKMKGWMGRPRLKARMLAHLKTLQEIFGAGATYLGTDEDFLFEATYVHKHNKPGTCNICALPDGVCSNARPSTCGSLGCDQERLIHRKRHEANEFGPTAFVPEVHFGQIGCGDQVMKSGEHRDCIAKDEDVIAFEMEGAGVWDKFPCIVIKGVCDYSDSHKNKSWQVYAACTAASCAKGLLQEW